MRAPLVLLFLLVLFGCAAPQVGAPAWPSVVAEGSEALSSESSEVAAPRIPHAPARKPLLDPPIAEHISSLRVDLQSLPVAPTEQAARGESVALSVDLSDVSIAMAHGLVVELQLGDVSVFSQNASTLFHGPANGSLRPLNVRCSELGDREVRWRGFVAEGVTPQAMPFVEFTGRYDAKHCKAVATRRRAVTAAAIVPGVIYAFRVCDDCEANVLGPTVERLVVIAPPSPFFLESAASASELPRPHVGSFSIGELPIKVGSPSSLSLWLPVAAFDASGLAISERMLGAERVKVDLEVSRSSELRPAEMRLHLAVLKAEPKVKTTVEAASAGSDLAPTVVRRLRRGSN